ncbi:MAG: nicotinate (nicotinamide) nucleotide adenylyltransferase [Sulfurospirillaceae bacterium]|jgi:nicotinate-nucleotide adenylyltransferase|nr:nicotinate (nicotinamide) nucleotide adenylyltransferase [Sulfurospirillaceae bacterium]MCK9545891.1 nicotinate (nicotinamide) nucleotide adenylyltransferase [Sulfurospirillaceae bacterium]MDY0237672.1 nicotinate (nicotinamide) nucleotide adenylyltransferase [Campylobacterales bacterium]
MRLAFFGGSFDPPHLGHEAIIKETLSSFKIDKLIIMPTWLSPFKKSFCAPANLRYEWVKKAWESEKVTVSSFEIDSKRAVPTIESIEHIKLIYNPKKIYLILGFDNFKSLKNWHRYEDLKKEVEFVIASREGEEAKGLKNLNINVSISSSKLRSRMDSSFLPTAVRHQVFKYYQTRIEMEKRVESIVSLLDSKKAENIQVFNMEDKDYFVSQVIIASTLGERHGLTLLDELKDRLKPLGEEFLHIDPASEWVVVDLGDILIHLMTPEYRAKYNIEEFLADFEKARA